MSSELFGLLVQFQPDAPELQQKRDYDTQIRAFIASVGSVSPHYFLKGADTSQDVLSMLNPTVNSISYAYTLLRRISAALDKKTTVPDSLKPGGSLWNKLVLFLESFDPVQMRYVGAEWRRLVEHVENIARALGTPAIAISPIRSTLLRLDPTSGTFTSIHLSFIRLCMESRSYTAALPILDNYIHSLPTDIPKSVWKDLEYSVPCADTSSSGEFIHLKSGHSDKVTLTDVQEYYVLGAMAYLGVGQFMKARQFLEHVLVVPSNNLSNGLMLEAYKKWVLVSCLVDGSYKSVPRTANGQAIKQVRAASKAYEALSDAFSELNNLPKLKAQVAAGREIWAEDGNTGLVHELMAHQYRYFVSRLSRTFSAVPISNIISNVGGTIEELTTYLETLIKDGFLNARLERNDKPEVGAVLRFYLDPTQGPLAKTEKQQQQALFEQTHRTNMLAGQVKDADYRLSLTKEYAEFVKRQNKKAAAGGNANDAMDVTWDDNDADEDLMGDMR